MSNQIPPPEPDANADEEAAVVRALMAPALYGGETPQHVETHLSHLFLTSERVYKLKKRVDWSVVDYSTVDRREAFCRRELEVNRRFAPELYLGVVPVTRDGAGFAIGGAGEVADWLVEMRRFDSDGQLDIMADRGALTGTIIDATADVIADMHRTAPPVRGPASEAVAALTDQLRRDVAADLAPAAARDVNAWAEAARADGEALAGRIDARGRHGFVRRCHGDLHLSNLCMWQGRPMPFDAIEFSEDIATIDVLYDLAFAVVDLDARDQHAHATRLTSRYLEATRDYGGLALLPLFLSQRAMVRALTRKAKGQPFAPLVALANHYIAERPQPRLVAIGGLSGSGKSTVARALSAAFDTIVIRSDVVRKRLMGAAPEQRLGAVAYTPTVTERVYRRLATDARRALAAGAPVIVDATFTDPARRAALGALAAGIGVPFVGLWLEAPEAVLRQRVAARRADASDADEAVLAAQLAHDPGPLDWLAVDADGSPDVVAGRAIAALRQGVSGRSP